MLKTKIIIRGWNGEIIPKPQYASAAERAKPLIYKTPEDIKKKCEKNFLPFGWQQNLSIEEYKKLVGIN